MKDETKTPKGPLDREVRRGSMEWNQQKCLDLGFKYWRAPDAHGVKCTKDQAIELMQELLGVEVEIVDA